MKLVLSDLLKSIAEYRYLGRKVHDQVLYQQLSTDGFVMVPNFISTKKAIELSSTVDELHQACQERLADDNQDGSDERFYGIDRYSDAFDFFLNDEQFELFSLVTHGHRSGNKFVLSNILRVQEGSIGSGGGWHRDSPYSHQFKVFLFLEDVELENGPFCYVRESHKREKIREFCKFLGISTNQYRFEDIDVEAAIKKLGLDKVVFQCAAGTMLMADTRGLHRGMPLISGTRKALTNYYFRGAIPSRFGVFDDSVVR